MTRPHSPRSRVATFVAVVCVVLGSAYATAQSGPQGALRGTVYDADLGVPVAGARVSLVEALLASQTSAEGAFLIEKVPPGSYTLTVAKEGFARKVVTGVVVTGGGLRDVGRLELETEVVELPPMVVSGVDILAGSELEVLDLRKESVALQDAISAEAMSAAGASDVAGALKSVVGASIRDGKYATVRGLSDRYTGTTLNGVRVPSADPRRRAVQVDQFPTGTIDSVTVTKTFTPDLQGDFTGGGVDIRTKAIPDASLLALSISQEHDSLATSNDGFLTYAGGGVETFGTTPSSRRLPMEALAAFPTAPDPGLLQTTAAAEFYDRATRAFQPVMGVSRSEAGANRSASLIVGERYELGEGRVLGVVGALTRSHKFSLYEGGQNNTGVVTGPDSPVELRKPREDTRGVEEVLIGTLANVVYRPREGHELGFNLVLNQTAEDEARFQLWRFSPTSVEQNQTLQYTERQVRSLQLHGRHDTTEGRDATRAGRGATYDWFVASNYTRQDQPDIRFFRNFYFEPAFAPSSPSNSTDAQNTRRIFRDVDETSDQAAFNVMVPLARWPDREGQLKVGVYFDRTERTFVQRSFTYRFAQQFGFNAAVFENLSKGGQGVVLPHADLLWTDVFLDPDRIGLAANRCEPGLSPFFFNCASANQLLWYISPVGGPSGDVDYDATQHLDAVYGMVDLPVTSRLKLVGGARFERTKLSIAPDNPLLGRVEIIELLPSGARAIVQVPDEEAATRIRRTDLLPSLGTVWRLGRGADMFLRASWSRTLARPTFRELAPVATGEFLDGEEFIGNPDLQLSTIRNYDLRWEWFRRSGEVLAASLFFKELDNAIEYISFAANNRNFVQPLNFESGTVRGYEVEARSGLDALHPGLRNVTVGFNYANLDTEVDVPRIEQDSLAAYGLDEPTRRLQGQPEYIVNLSLLYENDETGTSASVFYNRTGRTLLTGAAVNSEDGNPDVLEDASSSLDLGLKQELLGLGRRLGADVSISLRARNVFQPAHRTLYVLPRGEFAEAVKSERETPLRLSAGVSFKW